MLLVNGSVLGAMVDLIHAVAEFLSLFFAGVLAGKELVICYGVRTVIAVLDQQPRRRDVRGDTGLLQRRPVTANLKALWLNWSIRAYS
jgi:hypothetical protein